MGGRFQEAVGTFANKDAACEEEQAAPRTPTKVPASIAGSLASPSPLKRRTPGGATFECYGGGEGPQLMQAAALAATLEAGAGGGGRRHLDVGGPSPSTG